uniref:COesterase domain-containing protein n=1 Tax=Macrostomum lignano TaxID=282301 RepID=A0A1I8FET8_9PLAT
TRSCCRFLTGQSGASGLPGTGHSGQCLHSPPINRTECARMAPRSRRCLATVRPVGDVRPPGGGVNLPELVKRHQARPGFPQAVHPVCAAAPAQQQADSLVGGLRLRPKPHRAHSPRPAAARTVDLSACAGSLTTLRLADRRGFCRPGIAACTGYRPPPGRPRRASGLVSALSTSWTPDLIRTLGRLSDQRRRVPAAVRRSDPPDRPGRPDGRGGSRLADRLGVADSSIRRSDALSEAIDAGAGANLTVGLSARPGIHMATSRILS